jgi:hypothetical protein
VADIAWSDVEAHAPELSTTGAAAQTNILAFVNDALRVSDLDGETGPKTKLTRIYLAAHMGTADALAQRSTAGPVASETVDGLSRSYATAAPSSVSDDFLALTGYGRSYLFMVRTSAARAPLLLG